MDKLKYSFLNLLDLRSMTPVETIALREMLESGWSIQDIVKFLTMYNEFLSRKEDQR